MFPLENSVDAHNRFFVHRNALFYLKSRHGGRLRTPIGRKSQILNGKTAYPIPDDSELYYPKKYGVDQRKIDQLLYPRVKANWPLHKWRLLWVWYFDLYARVHLMNRLRRKPRSQWRKKGFEMPAEWRGVRLPGMTRPFFASTGCMNTRWAVPVEGNLTRIWYFSAWRNRGKIRRFMTRTSFKLYKRAVFDLDYGGQDYRAAKSVRYNNPERLSASDSHLIQIRTLITEYGRGLDNEHVRRRVAQETLADNTTGEANPGQSPDIENEGEQLGDGYTARVESS